MRVVIVGATGNAGTALLRRLRAEPDVEAIGIARRTPEDSGPYADMEWHPVDVGHQDALDRLVQIFQGADAVVNLAWQIQPSHDARRLYQTNVLGSRTVFRAALRAGVATLVHASSVGVYSPGPKWAFVTEGWLRNGVPESSYSRHKALVERMLDEIESDHPTLRVVRLRPGLIFQRDAGTEIGRYFAGPLLPARLLRFGWIPALPAHPGLRMQAVHADDVADAYLRVLRADVHGAFNIAAGPVLDPLTLARTFRGLPVPVPGFALEGAAALSWRLRLQPVDRGWVRLALKAPLMSCDRAAGELGWRPATDALDALRELVTGLAERAGRPESPALNPVASQPGRFGGLLRGRLPGTGDPY
ncbi:NAD-dependent epimerase/dehydratase family protein [Actinoplanes teichomyceticus]|uniref:Nucleoside-diphosphate-sugar epimerase n=1 Tax=Actinoplanes teichomyceticus TaxID=1867 RepID=A0A561WMU4_ACTTI|nr:NAD-dependent epimerase/dehydratase family protein [Actinoplanes teichomyceticus]TWG25153.1 nucleoside-diphosphate-sugar epimerase [Actinoplanes teichomyceticus]GIF10224.1 NAD-dependent epimerase [Actinoplanes teichomyceticus]